MIQTFSGRQRGDNQELFRQLFKLRHKLFVSARKWTLPTQNGMDIDQYDVADAQYFVRQDSNGNVECHVRLTPTRTHSLLADYFPHLVEGNNAARGDTIYEATRYIVMPTSKSRESNRAAKAELLLAMLRWVEAKGGTHVQTVIDTATFASFCEMTLHTQALGLSFPFGGGPSVSGGGECMAIRWPVNQQVMHDLIAYGDLDCSLCGQCSRESRAA